MQYEQYFLQMMNGLSIAAILILIGYGLAVIFGMMKIINWAHGELFMLGAYVVLLVTRAGGNHWLAVAAAPVIVALVGVVLERVFVRRFYGELIATILLTWGLSMVLRQLVKLIVGAESRSIANPLAGSIRFLGISYPIYRLFIILLVFAVVSFVSYLMMKTKFGLYCRAVIQDREMAGALGVEIHHIDMLAFALGAGLAGLAGAIMAPLLTVEPEMGLQWLGDAFLVVILGGAGQIMGVVASGLVLGALRAIVSFSIGPIWSSVLVLLFACGIIRFRPDGLLGGPRRRR